jgi:hypothetical protein
MSVQPQSVQGSVLRHTIREGDSAESIQTQRVCYSHTKADGLQYCLPSRHFVGSPGRLGADALIKANEDAVEISSRILNRDLDAPFLEKLFREDNFQTISGAARIDAVYDATSLTYTPLHGIGAFKISNPSLPEIFAAAMKQSVVRLTHNFLFAEWAGDDYGIFFLSPSLYWYDRTYAFLETDLVAVAVQKPSDLVDQRNSKRLDGDISFSFLSKNPFLPSLGLSVFNVASDPACESCGRRFFDLEASFERSFLVSSSLRIPHPFGTSNIGLALPIRGASPKIDKDGAAIAWRYWLSRLGAFVSYGSMSHTFGFLFGPENYQIGIQYTDEKQDTSIQRERKKHTYVFTSLAL